jgi:hypothetical protein
MQLERKRQGNRGMQDVLWTLSNLWEIKKRGASSSRVALFSDSISI